MKKFILITILIVAIGLLSFYFYFSKHKGPIAKVSPSPAISISANATTSPSSISQFQLAEPVKDFKDRVTKKPFGIYITPENSPIQPERFNGYHTGADAEYEDVTDNVAVFAIADGTITYSQWTSGYGGCFILEIKIDNSLHSVLYGHIRPSTLPSVGQQFKKDDQIAVLGTAFSQETDGERRHLHLSILSDDQIDVKSYVSSKSQLSGWLDPLSFY